MTEPALHFFPNLLLPELRVASNIEMHSHTKGTPDHG